jgi:hypothetical protein
MSARLLKTELYLGRGDASMALAISSLKVASERTDGRTLDCCILRKCDVAGGKLEVMKCNDGEVLHDDQLLLRALCQSPTCFNIEQGIYQRFEVSWECRAR